MRTFLSAAVTVTVTLLALVGAVAQLQEPAADEQRPLHAAAAVEKLEQMIRERVIELPEDGDKWHTTIVYRDPQTDAASAKLAAQFAATPRLQSLLAQTHVHTWTAKDPIWRSRYAREFGNVAPGVEVQMADGRMIYKASGTNLPEDGEQLAGEIAAAVASCCPDAADKTRRPLADKFVPDLRSPSLKGPKEMALAALLAIVAGIVTHLVLRPVPKPT